METENRYGKRKKFRKISLIPNQIEFSVGRAKMNRDSNQFKKCIEITEKKDGKTTEILFKIQITRV